MSAKELRIEHTLADADLPDWLRSLADWIESGCETDQPACTLGIPSADIRSVKLGLKRRGGTLALRLIVKGDSPDDSAQAPPPSAKTTTKASARRRNPAYKPLKKRLGISFKTILAALENGTLPPQEALAAFIDDSRLMAASPGKGQEFYPEYAAACTALEAAVEAKDLAAAALAAETLTTCKRRCHAKYK